MKFVRFVKTHFFRRLLTSCPVEDRHCCCSHSGFIDPLTFFPVCEGVSFNSAVSLCVLSRCGFGVCRPETERSDRVSARKKELCWSHGDLPHTLANTHTHTPKHTNQKSKPSFAASVCEVCLPSAIDFSFRIMAPSSAGSLTPAGSEFHRPDSDFDWCASDGSSCRLVLLLLLSGLMLMFDLFSPRSSGGDAPSLGAKILHNQTITHHRFQGIVWAPW